MSLYFYTSEQFWKKKNLPGTTHMINSNGSVSQFFFSLYVRGKILTNRGLQFNRDHCFLQWLELYFSFCELRISDEKVKYLFNLNYTRKYA